MLVDFKKKGRKVAAFFEFINLIGLHSHSFSISTHLFNFFTANFTAESDETRGKQEGDFVVNHSEKERNKCLMDNFCLSFKIGV